MLTSPNIKALHCSFHAPLADAAEMAHCELCAPLCWGCSMSVSRQYGVTCHFADRPHTLQSDNSSNNTASAHGAPVLYDIKHQNRNSSNELDRAELLKADPTSRC